MLNRVGGQSRINQSSRLSRVERVALAAPVVLVIVGLVAAFTFTDDSAAIGNVGEWFAGSAAMAAIAVLMSHRLEDEADRAQKAKQLEEEEWRTIRLEALATVATLRMLYRHDEIPSDAFGPVFAARAKSSARLVSLAAATGVSEKLHSLIEEHLSLIVVHDERAARHPTEPEARSRKERSQRLRAGLAEMELELAMKHG